MQILFALSFTLSVIEVTQYIAFSTSRAHAAGDVSQTLQTEAAKNKYRELVTQPPFGPLFSGGWFTISKPGEFELRGGGESSDTFDDEYNSPDRGIPFEGVRTKLTAKMLNFQVPFIGKTVDEDDGLSTSITAFLIREPTLNECQEFMRARQTAIKNLDPSRFGSLNIKDDAYVPLEDNGC